MDIVYETDTWLARIATPADNRQLCDIMRNVDMQSDLHVVEERDPDFFAIHRLHQGEPCTLVIEDKTGTHPSDNKIVSFCSAVIRTGWLNGLPQRVAYVCDLRMVSGYRNQRVLPTACRRFFDYLETEKQVRAFYSASLNDNKGAVAARRFSGGRILCHFDMVNLQLVGRSVKAADRLPQAHGFSGTVSKATQSDGDALAEFLNEHARSRQFGYIYSAESLQQRLSHWPDLTIEDFYLAKSPEGKILACCAPWNPAASNLRKTRILAYHGKMKWIKRIYNAEAALRGFKKLPAAGGYLDQITLTHLEVSNENPDIFRALLSGVFADYRKQDIHFINFMLPTGSPLEPALKGLRQQRIRFDLNCFSPSFLQQIEPSNKPGFEMAIH